MSRQFSGDQEFYPSRGGGTLGADRKAATALVFQQIVAGVASTVAIQGDDGSIIAIQATALVADDVIINAAIVFVNALGGGSVFVNQGTYIIAAIVNMANNLVFDFQSAELQLGYDGNMIDLNGSTDVKIFGGEADGQKAIHNVGTFSGITGEGTRILIKGCRFHDFEGKGIFVFLHYSDIEDVWSQDNDQDGIYLRGSTGPDNPSNDVTFLNCICWNNDRKGFNNDFIIKINFIACKSYSNTEDGWNLEGGTSALNDYFLEDIKLHGCYAYSNGQMGFRVQMGHRRVSLIDCQGFKNTNSGLSLRGRDDEWTIFDAQVIGGQYFENDDHGILFAYGIKHLKILSLSTFNNDQSTTNNNGLASTNLTNMEHVIIDDIHTYDDQLVPTQDRGISINADVTGQDIVIGRLRGTGNTNELARLGLGVIMPCKTFQFIQGTTVISADGSAKGWEINAEADMAFALGQLPPEVQQVVRIKIWAVALDAPPGSPGNMHLDILFNAGGSLEAWNLAANSWTLANFDSEEADYVNTNVIHWVVEDGDVGNELSNLLGGDSLELKVNGGTAVAPDGATNATFRCVEIEYV